MAVGLDALTGRIGVARGPSPTSRYRLEVCDKHPDTDVRIEGFQIPHWPEILEIVSKGASAFPELRTIGWDVAVTTTGIFLLEGNHNWDPEGPQISLQRGVRTEMEALVAEVLKGNRGRHIEVMDRVSMM